MKKSELRQLIREELKRIKESHLDTREERVDFVVNHLKDLTDELNISIHSLMVLHDFIFQTFMFDPSNVIGTFDLNKFYPHNSTYLTFSGNRCTRFTPIDEENDPFKKLTMIDKISFNKLSYI